MTFNNESYNTFTSIAAGNQTSNVDVDTDSGGDLAIFVDDGSGGAPADHTVIVERYSPGEDRWMEFGRTSRTGNTEPQSFVDPQVPTRMRVRVQNDSAGSADYRVNVVTY